MKNITSNIEISLSPDNDHLNIEIIGDICDSIPKPIRKEKDLDGNIRTFTEFYTDLLNPQNKLDTFYSFIETSTHADYQFMNEYPTKILLDPRDEKNRIIKKIIDEPGRIVLSDRIITEKDTTLTINKEPVLINLCENDSCTMFFIKHSGTKEIARILFRGDSTSQKVFKQKTTGNFIGPKTSSIYTRFRFRYGSHDNSHFDNDNKFKISLTSEYRINHFNFFPEPDSMSYNTVSYNSLDKIKIISEDGLLMSGGQPWAQETRNNNNFIVSITIGALISLIITSWGSIISKIENNKAKLNETKQECCIDSNSNDKNLEMTNTNKDSSINPSNTIVEKEISYIKFSKDTTEENKQQIIVDNKNNKKDDKTKNKDNKLPIRNDKCPCGSGKKYKNCCIKK